MFTSIKKISKIPIFFFRNPSERDISEAVTHHSAAEGIMTMHLIELNRKNIDEIIGIQDSVEGELDGYEIRELKGFFLRYPSAWHELKRKLHSLYEKYQGSIPKEAEEKILSVFLRLGREEVVSDNIEQAWRKEILSNRSLLTGASREPSLLDSSHEQLKILSLSSKKQRQNFIKKMIEASIRINTDVSNSDISMVFSELLPVMIHYLKDIFSIKIDQQKKFSLDGFSKMLAEQIWEVGGIDGKNAWMLVKAFRAWGGYKDIELQTKKAEARISYIPNKFHLHGMTFDHGPDRKEISFNETITVHTGKVTLTLKSGAEIPIHIEYRAKSLRSLLLKMWENEDYNNIDANRDTIGIALIWGDGTSTDDKMECLSILSRLFANKGYILKNKLHFDAKGIQKLKDGFKFWEKKPLGTIVSEKKEKSSKGFKNASYSGFTRIDEEAMGVELQVFDQKDYAFWKEEHYEFDPIKVMSAWSRGSWFLTPIQAIHAIRDNINADILETKLRKRSQQVLWDYITSGRLIPYVGREGEVYIVPVQHEYAFHQKFTKAHPIAKNDKIFYEFIDTLSSSSILPSSSPPPSQDR